MGAALCLDFKMFTYCIKKLWWNFARFSKWCPILPKEIIKWLPKGMFKKTYTSWISMLRSLRIKTNPAAVASFPIKMIRSIRLTLKYKHSTFEWAEQVLRLEAGGSKDAAQINVSDISNPAFQRRIDLSVLQDLPDHTLNLSSIVLEQKQKYCVTSIKLTVMHRNGP